MKVTFTPALIASHRPVSVRNQVVAFAHKVADACTPSGQAYALVETGFHGEWASPNHTYREKSQGYIFGEIPSGNLI